jgi:hypothetical protein
MLLAHGIVAALLVCGASCGSSSTGGSGHETGGASGTGDAHSGGAGGSSGSIDAGTGAASGGAPVDAGGETTSDAPADLSASDGDAPDARVDLSVSETATPDARVDLSVSDTATPDARADLSAPDADASGDAVPPPVFIHPGLLHSEADFDRMKSKVLADAQPWRQGWDRLIANSHAQLTWTARPAAIVFRGNDGMTPQNYPQLYNDIAAAYALALRWKISGDAAYADKAVQILDAWSGTLTAIQGTADRFLAAGLYGYQFANAAEIMRTYSGWSPAGLARFKDMMLRVFYPMNHDFLVRQNGACVTHYWANWDLCNMSSILAIGVLTDDRAIYDEAVNYFKNGAGNGSIGNAVFFVHPGNLGQWQESGRDQGHATLGIGLMGAFCEMAWKQGDDLYGYSDNRFLAGAEYVARYNLGNDVPYVTYRNCDPVTQTVIAPAGRGDIRPIWELVYHHYVNRRRLAAPNVAAYAAMVRPEGGGGDYGPNSGGFDQLGYGTLTFTLDPPP